MENSKPSTSTIVSTTKASAGRSKKGSKKPPPSDQRRCYFCGEGDEYANELECGEFREPTRKQFSIHYFCLLLSSDIQQKHDFDEAHDPLEGFSTTAIIKRKKRSYTQVCHYCGEKSATIKCSFGGCKVRFHLPCGRKNQSFHGFHDEYKSYCRDHWPAEVLSIEWNESELDNCLICTLPFLADESNRTLVFTNCCTPRSICHRQCAQQLAINFADYHVRCPKCRNQPKFKKNLIDVGIYVPIRDASWEFEGRFRDHYVGPTECTSTHCKCPYGAEFETNENINGDDALSLNETSTSISSSTDDDQWRMLKCYCCGDVRHIACMPEPKWIIDEDGNEQRRYHCYVCSNKEEPIGNIFEGVKEKRRSIGSTSSMGDSSRRSSGYSDDQDVVMIVDDHQSKNQTSTAAVTESLDESTIDLMDELSMESDGSSNSSDLPATNDVETKSDEQEVVHMDEDENDITAETVKISTKDSSPNRSTNSIRSQAKNILESIADERTTTNGGRSVPAAVGDLNAKRSSIDSVGTSSDRSTSSIRLRAEQLLESVAAESTTNGGGPSMPNIDVICLSDDEDVGTNGVEKSAVDSAKERKKRKKGRKNREKAAREDDIIIIDDEDQPSTSKKPRTPKAPSKNTNRHHHNNNTIDLTKDASIEIVERNASIEVIDDDDDVQFVAELWSAKEAFEMLLNSTIRENAVFHIGV